MKKLWRWVLIFLALTLLAGLLFVPISPDAEKTVGGEVVEVEAGPEGLALSAWVRSKSLEPKATFQVFVQAQNQSDLAITAGPASQGLPESLPLGALPDAQPVGGGAEG